MGQSEPTRRTIPPAGPGGADPGIPDKLYFRIGEVARLCEVPTYVLRFWETEFPQLKPNKGGTGQRLYRRRDVEMALHIKRLLYDEGYTIPGARQVFKAELREKEAQLPLLAPEPPHLRELHGVRRELEAIANLLAHPPAAPSPALRPAAHKAVHPIGSQKRTAGPNPEKARAAEIPFDAASPPTENKSAPE